MDDGTKAVSKVHFMNMGKKGRMSPGKHRELYPETAYLEWGLCEDNKRE